MQNLWCWVVVGVGFGCGGGGDDGPRGPRDVVLTILDRPTDAGARLVVAYQDGDGPWTPAPALVGDDTTFTVESGRYSALLSCKYPASETFYAGTVELFHATVEDTQQITMTACGNPRTQPIEVTVSNLGANEFVNINSREIFEADGTKTIPLFAGKQDVIANAVIAGQTGYHTIRLQIARDVDIAPGAAVAFDLSPSVAITTPYLQPNPVLEPGERITSVFSTLHTATTESTLLSHSRAAPVSFATIPVDRLAPTDVLEITASVGTDLPFRRGITQWHHDATTASFEDLPAALSLISTDVIAQSPAVRLRTTWSTRDETQLYLWSASQPLDCGPSDFCTNQWSARVTPDWLAGDDTYDMPDPAELAALPGWDPSRAFVRGEPVTVSVSANHSNRDYAAFGGGYQPDGTVIRFSLATQQIMP